MADINVTPSRGLPLGLTGATVATRYVGGNASGAPASGTFAVADYVVNGDGSLWVCTVAGSPGTWVDTSTINPSITQFVRNPSGLQSSFSVSTTEQGTATTAFSNRLQTVLGQASDAAGVVNKTVSGAVSNGGPNLIRLTITGHTFLTGDNIAVYGVGGTTEANAQWSNITVIDANTVDLPGSVFVHAFVSNGTATNRGILYASMGFVGPTVARGGLSGGSDDADCFIAGNNGTAKATDMYYGSHNSAFAGVSEFKTTFSSAANSDYGIFLSGLYQTSAFDLASATFAGGGSAIRLPNNIPMVARNAANNADIEVLRVNAAGVVVFSFVGGAVTTSFTGPVQIGWSQNYSDGVNITFGTSSGNQIGTATNQLIGFYGTTPVVQPGGGTDVLASLVSLGLRAASANPPLNLGTGLVTSGGTNTSGGAGFSTETFVSGTAAQLSQTTKNAQLITTVTLAGTLTLAIGPTSAAANVVVNAAAVSTGEILSCFIPAGWWVKYTLVTATIVNKAITQ